MLFDISKAHPVDFVDFQNKCDLQIKANDLLKKYYSCDKHVTNINAIIKQKFKHFFC